VPEALRLRTDILGSGEKVGDCADRACCGTDIALDAMVERLFKGMLTMIRRYDRHDAFPASMRPAAQPVAIETPLRLRSRTVSVPPSVAPAMATLV